MTSRHSDDFDPESPDRPDGSIRLHKYIADCGYTSRRKAEELISEGRVKVNGKIVSEPGTKIDPVHDRVQVGQRFLRPPPRGILLLNKPRGVVSTMSDPEGRPTVADFLTKHYRSYYPVGRLDWDSSGLIVFTNDGELAQRLMHPRFGFDRTYQVRVEGRPSDAALRKLETGVKLRDGMASGKVKLMKDDEKSAWLEITVSEGRNRLVRRMLEKIEHPVMKLKRISHGPFKLGKLQPGEVRHLTEKEYQQLRKKVLGSEAAQGKPARPKLRPHHHHHGDEHHEHHEKRAPRRPRPKQHHKRPKSYHPSHQQDHQQPRQPGQQPRQHSHQKGQQQSGRPDHAKRAWKKGKGRGTRLNQGKGGR